MAVDVKTCRNGYGNKIASDAPTAYTTLLCTCGSLGEGSKKVGASVQMKADINLNFVNKNFKVQI